MASRGSRLGVLGVGGWIDETHGNKPTDRNPWAWTTPFGRSWVGGARNPMDEWNVAYVGTLRSAEDGFD